MIHWKLHLAWFVASSILYYLALWHGRVYQFKLDKHTIEKNKKCPMCEKHYQQAAWLLRIHNFISKLPYGKYALGIIVGFVYNYILKEGALYARRQAQVSRMRHSTSISRR